MRNAAADLCAGPHSHQLGTDRLLAAILIALGVSAACLGQHLAGTPSGLITDHSGVFSVLYPAVDGVADSGASVVLGDLLQSGGFVMILVGLFATI